MQNVTFHMTFFVYGSIKETLRGSYKKTEKNVIS